MVSDWLCHLRAKFNFSLYCIRFRQDTLLALPSDSDIGQGFKLCYHCTDCVSVCSIPGESTRSILIAMYQSARPSRGQLRFSSKVGTGHSATVSSIMLAPLGPSDQAVGALLLSFSGCLLALGSQLPWPHDSWRPRQ